MWDSPWGGPRVRPVRRGGSCLSQSSPRATGQPAAQRVLLVGNPNVGKSVLFNLLTGSYAVVSNYPGTTVEVSRGRLRGLGRRPEVVDTPGVNTLTPLSLDELVTRDILLNESDYVVVQVVDSRNLTRGLRITAELAELGVPVTIALNMVDEALREGIHISAEKLGDLLGLPVVPTVAVERRGIGELFQAIKRSSPPRLRVDYGPAIEEAILELTALLPDLPLGKRGLSVMLLAADEGVERWVGDRVAPDALGQIRRIRERTASRFNEPLDYVLAAARWRAAEELSEAVSVRRRVSVSRGRELASSATMHPVWGAVILAAVLYAMYLVVGRFGAGTVADFLSTYMMGSAGERVMALGDRSRPAAVSLAGGWIAKDEGTRLLLRARSPADLVLRLRPGPGCAKFLRQDTAYGVQGHLQTAGTGWPRVAVRLTYLDGGTEELPVPLVDEGRGVYRLQGLFRTDAEAARYEVNIELRDAGEATVGPVTLDRQPTGLLNPFFHNLATRHLPPGLMHYVLVGEYGVVTMGLTLAFGIVLPIVTFFFLFLALIEDSGYLARLTVLANRLFTYMGLNGRACVPIVLGLGCDTMATLSARILESRDARLIVTFLLALGVPCSAQLGVVMGLAGAVGPVGLLLVFGVVITELFAAGHVASRILGGPRPDFIVEIPLLRLPTAANVLRKTWQRAEWFLREALPYFILGTGVLAVLSWFHVLDLAERAFRPVIVSLLSLPPESTYAFLVGFLRRDYGAAGLFELRYDGRLDNLQTVVALITMTLFVPCLANSLVMIKEQGLKRACVMIALIIVLAILTGAAVNWTLRGLGVVL